jgi:hypothetical protein
MQYGQNNASGLRRDLSAMLTNKGKYGLKALVDLAGLEPGRRHS